MRLTIFGHWFGRLRELPATWRRFGIATLVCVALFVAGLAAGRWLTLSSGDAARVRELTAQNARLQDNLSILQREHRTIQTANRVLQQNLAARDQELQHLKADQAFYAKLIGSDASETGLAVHDIDLEQIAGTRAWNFVVTLTNPAKGADTARGTLTVSVRGVRDGKLAVADWAALAGPAGKGGIPFSFKFFQQLRGTLMLPEGFVPNRILVSLDPKDGPIVTRKLAWGEAAKSPPGTATSTP